jgi:hypothetical protein
MKTNLHKTKSIDSEAGLTDSSTFLAAGLVSTNTYFIYLIGFGSVSKCTQNCVLIRDEVTDTLKTALKEEFITYSSQEEQTHHPRLERSHGPEK